jgi:hypothetical protein
MVRRVLQKAWQVAVRFRRCCRVFLDRFDNESPHRRTPQLERDRLGFWNSERTSCLHAIPSDGFSRLFVTAIRRSPPLSRSWAVPDPERDGQGGPELPIDRGNADVPRPGARAAPRARSAYRCSMTSSRKARRRSSSRSPRRAGPTSGPSPPRRCRSSTCCMAGRTGRSATPAWAVRRLQCSAGLGGHPKPATDGHLKTGHHR